MVHAIIREWNEDEWILGKMLLIIDIRRDDTSLGQFTLGKSMVNFNIYSTTQVNKGGIRVDAKEGIRLPLDVLYCFDLK